MRLAIISLDDSDSIQAGGKHIHQQLLMKGLREAGHEVYSFFPRRSYGYLLLRVFFVILRKLKLINKGQVYKWTLKRHMNDLINKINSFGKPFDAVLTQDPVSAVAAYEALKNKKTFIVVTLHGYLSLESVNYGSFNEVEKNVVIKCAREYEQRALEVADSVITVDSRIAEYVKREFNYLKNAIILKNAINPEIFNVLTPKEIESLRLKHGISGDKKIVLIPRRLVKKNGVEVAIRALPMLKKAGYINFVFMVMGDGPLYKELIELRENLEITPSELIFLGSIEHSKAAQYYDIADVVLVPSIISDGIEEATSLSMLEGMAAKKVVIVSNIGGMKEVIEHCKNGFIFKQNNPQDLADLISNINKMNEDQVLQVKKQAFHDVCSLHHYRHHSVKYLEQIQFS